MLGIVGKIEQYDIRIGCCPDDVETIVVGSLDECVVTIDYLDILAFSLRLVYKRSGSIVVTRVTFAERNFFALFVQVPQRF